LIPIHNHSEYSALDGYSKTFEIADRIEELGLPGAFLTDHGTVAGLTSFADAMTWKDKKKGIKRDLSFGLGMEAYQARNSRTDTKLDGVPFKKGQDAFHLILLAKGYKGYQNLLRISDEAHRTGFYYDARVDWDLLKKYREGLICTTACIGSLVNKSLLEDGNREPLDKLGEIFGDDFYIELSTYNTDLQRDLNQTLVGIANDKGIGVLYANDAHYTSPELWPVHEALICAQYNSKLDDIKGRKVDGKFVVNNPDNPDCYHPQSLYIMGEAEVRKCLDHLPESIVNQAISNSDAIMEQCRFELPKPGLYLPKFKLKEDDATDTKQLLIDLVAEGITERYQDATDAVWDEAWERSEFELKAIIEAGLHDYFLIVWDFINHAIRHGGLIGPGRGSVGGSIIAYALGITAIDPIKYGLQFERFWNPGRADGLPDIDIDFERSARQFMIEYVKRKYGPARVLPVGNHIFIRPKSAIDKAGAVLYDKPPYGLMVKVKEIIESTTDAGQALDWDDMWDTLQDWADRDGTDHPLAYWQEQEPQLFALAKLLEGRISTYGVHASAVVISSVDLADHLPARMASDDEKRKVIVTQAEMHQVEKEGFPKFDFLGLRNLDTLMLTAIMGGDFGDPAVLGPKVAEIIEARNRGEFVEGHPEAREAMVKVANHFRNEVNYNTLADSYWELIDNGHTLGLFQVEEGFAAKRIGKHIRPRSVEDLAAIVALNRPGPLRGGVVDRFLARRNGEEDTTYPHPILEGILEPTYGDFLYQEQVIAYFREIGYSLSDADHIRKILGKKLGEEMKAEFPIYMEKAMQHMPKGTAENIWKSIEDFSKYSFNKSHAVGYGLILAWTMYAKRRWPTEFVMASITTAPKKVAAYINEARRIGVSVLPPDINRSNIVISKVDNDILFGLRDVKGLGDIPAQWCLDNGPFESPEDFFNKAINESPVVMKKNYREALMAAGAFDAFGYRLTKCSQCDGRGKYKPDPDKRSYADCVACSATGYERTDLPTAQAIYDFEEFFLGVSLTDTNADLIEKNIERLEACAPLAGASETEKTEIKVPGVITKVEPRKNKDDAKWKPGAPWAKVTIQWKGEEVTFAAFPQEYEDFSYMLKPRVLGEFTLETGARGAKLKKGYKLT